MKTDFEIKKPIRLCGQCCKSKESECATDEIKRCKVLENASGCVTLMKLCKGKTIDTHTAPADVMVQILDGEADFTVENTKHRLCPGDSLLMPASTPHSVHAATALKFLLVKLNA